MPNSPMIVTAANAARQTRISVFIAGHPGNLTDGSDNMNIKVRNSRVGPRIMCRTTRFDVGTPSSVMTSAAILRLKILIVN